ncbi:endopolyphosphatase [Microdochium nivale]|nr:endopolyphosphatase [Microdochium nivale]
MHQRLTGHLARQLQLRVLLLEDAPVTHFRTGQFLVPCNISSRDWQPNGPQGRYLPSSPGNPPRSSHLFASAKSHTAPPHQSYNQLQHQQHQQHHGFATMSWMDSWSRPGKSQAVPAPYYLLPGGEGTPYCRSCGRVISSRKATASASASSANNHDKTAEGDAVQVKYCSARCRNNRPGKLDREIEEVFARLLQGQSHGDVAAAMGRAGGGDNDGGGGGGGGGEKTGPSLDAERKEEEGDAVGQQPAKTSDATGNGGEGGGGVGGSGGQHKRQKSKPAKGESRILVPCDEVEDIIFGKRVDPAKVFGRKKNRASRVIRPTAKQDGDDAGDNGPGNERLPSYGVTKFKTDSSDDDGVMQLDDGDDDDDGDDYVHSHDHDDDGSGDNTNNNNHDVVDGHTVAAMSVRSGARVRPAQSVSEVNGSVGGEKGWAERAGESEEMTRRRIEGQQRAQRKEMVRCAARRGVVFGFKLDGGGEAASAAAGATTQHEQRGGNTDKSSGVAFVGGVGGGSSSSSSKKKAKRASRISREKNNYSNDGEEDAEHRGGPAIRKCEAVMQGKVVEPSYAKGDWGVRWRED